MPVWGEPKLCVMEKLMIFDNRMKTKLGYLCALPRVSFLVCLVYYLTLLSPLRHGGFDPTAASGITSHNYDTLFIMLAIAGIIGAAVLIYCIVILARLKHLNEQTKVIWLLLLAAFVPVSIVFFWALVLNKEPKYVPVYPDID